MTTLDAVITACRRHSVPCASVLLEWNLTTAKPVLVSSHLCYLLLTRTWTRESSTG